MVAPVCVSRLSEGCEPETILLLHVHDQPFEHEHAMTAPDDLRVHCEIENAAWHLTVHIIELVPPDFLDLRGSGKTRAKTVAQPDILKMWKVVKDPAYGELNQISLLAKEIRTIRQDLIADPAPVGLEVLAHQRALVAKPVLKEQLDGMWAVVPCGRTVTYRAHTCYAIKHMETTLEDRALVVSGLERDRVFVEVAMMTYFVPCHDDRPHRIRIGIGSVTGNEEGSLYAVPIEKAKNAIDTDHTKLTS